MIAPEYQPAHRWRNVLSRSRRARAHVGTVYATDALRVAARHFEHLGPDLDQLALALLGGALTALAHRQRDLIARAPFIARPLQHRPSQEQQRCVVVERLSGIALELRQRLSHGREHLARDLESKHVARDARFALIRGPTSGSQPRDELFYVAHGFTLRRGQPVELGFGGRNTSQLAQC
jgi:hypothetical protein